MRGVIFGEYNTAEDWDLILNVKSLTPPSPKTTYVSIEGRDGDLDLSETLTGEIRYNNRDASYKFLLTEGTHSTRETLIADVMSAVHGKRLNIIDPDKPDFYLSGRCTVKETSNDKAYGSITIEANCEPWFYAKIETRRIFTISAETSIVLTNTGGKTLTPEVIVTGSINLSFSDSSVSLSDGTYKLTGLKLKTGNTLITASGSGTITFVYREGVL